MIDQYNDYQMLRNSKEESKISHTDTSCNTYKSLGCQQFVQSHHQKFHIVIRRCVLLSKIKSIGNLCPHSIINHTSSLSAALPPSNAAVFLSFPVRATSTSFRPETVFFPSSYVNSYTITHLLQRHTLPHSIKPSSFIPRNLHTAATIAFFSPSGTVIFMIGSLFLVVSTNDHKPSFISQTFSKQS